MRLAAELDEQPALPLGKQRDVLGVDALRFHLLDQRLVDAFAAGGTGFHYFRNMIGALVHVAITEHQQAAAGRTVDQPHFRAEHQRARSLGSDQRAGDMEAVLRQELRQVVAGHAPWNLRKARADLIDVPIAQIRQLSVNFVVAAARAHAHARSVVEEDVELFDVLLGLAAHHRMHAAGVVSDHSAERAVVVRGGIGREGEVPLLGSVAEPVEDHAGLDPGELAVVVDLQNPVQILRAIDHHRHVAALTGEAGPAAASDDGSAELARRGDRLDDVVNAPRNHHADRHLPIVGTVGRVQGAAAVVESYLAFDARPQRAFERARIELLSFRPVSEPYQLLEIHRSASLRLKSSPNPGRERSGLSIARSGCGAPSKSIRSIRWWSKNHSRWRMAGSAQPSAT